MPFQDGIMEIMELFKNFPTWVQISFMVGGALMSAFSNQFPLKFQEFGFYAGIFLILIGLIGLIRHIFCKSSLKKWFSSITFQWPIQKSNKWPYNAPLFVKIPHIRTFVFFDELNTRGIKVGLVYFNSSMHEVVIESIYGNVIYGIRSENKVPISWSDSEKQTRNGPLREFHINILLRPSEDEMKIIHELTKPGNKLSLTFDLKIKAKALDSGEIFMLETWYGVTCERPLLPIVTSEIIPLGNSPTVKKTPVRLGGTLDT